MIRLALRNLSGSAGSPNDVRRVLLPYDFEELVNHDLSDDCPVCRAQELTEAALVPATAAWEMRNDLPQYSLALHGAAGLLGAMIQGGISRKDVMAALETALDEIEQNIAEEDALGGPAQGNG
jgi:hypothetical protein